MSASFGKTIQIIRQAKGQSLQETAERAGISSPYLSLIEADRRRPSMDVLQNLSGSLGVPLEFLVRRSLAGEQQDLFRDESGQVQELSETIEKIRELEHRLRRLSRKNNEDEAVCEDHRS